MQFSIVALLSLAGAALAVPLASAAEPQCTTVLRVFPKMDLSPTKTVYESVVTTESRVDCDGCVLKIQTLPLGPGPVVFKTATITASTASTDYNIVCEPTPAN